MSCIDFSKIRFVEKTTGTCTFMNSSFPIIGGDAFPQKMCPYAFHAVFPYYLTLINGGWFSWVSKGEGVIVQCSNPHGSVEMPDEQHGAFTYHLVRGLRGEADLEHDGVVDADELWRYLRDRVADSARAQNVKQTPRLISAIGHRLSISRPPPSCLPPLHPL